MSDVLDDAVAALRDETHGEVPEAEAALARILASLEGDALLDEAARALAESESAAAAEVGATLERVQATLRAEGASPRSAGVSADASSDIAAWVTDRATDAHEDVAAATLARVRATLLASAPPNEIESPAGVGADAAIASAPRPAARVEGRSVWIQWAAAAALLLALVGAPTAWAWSAGLLPAVLASWSLGAPASSAPELEAPGRTTTNAARRGPEPTPIPVADPPSASATDPATAPAMDSASDSASWPRGTLPPTPSPREGEPISASASASTSASASASGSASASASDSDSASASASDSASATDSASRSARPSPSARADVAPPPDAVTVPDAETSLFAAAHRAHFVERDPVEALRAWDAYLRAHPHGRYEPEARYNRGLSLARLGRNAQAREALRPFADGAFDGYRQRAAREIVDALDARDSR